MSSNTPPIGGGTRRPQSATGHTSTVQASTRRDVGQTVTRRIPAWSTYRKLRTIGAGGFGQVFLVDGPRAPPQDGVPRDDDAPGDQGRQLFVAKLIYVGDDNEALAHSAATEVKVLQVVPPHTNVLSYVDHYLDDEGYLAIVVEHCALGDLEKLIAARRDAGRPFSLEEVLFLAFQLLAGVRHLHRTNVMHRDIKPANVFLVRHDDTAVPVPADADTAAARAIAQAQQEAQPALAEVDATRLWCRLADFGISRMMGTGSYANTVVGTPYYIPPEICESRPYTTSADMWAVGCIVYELAAQQKLFGGDNMLAVVRAISAAEVPPLPPPYDVLQPLVEALVQADPERRLTADEAIGRFFPTPQEAVQPEEEGQDEEVQDEEVQEEREAHAARRDERELEAA